MLLTKLASAPAAPRMHVGRGRVAERVVQQMGSAHLIMQLLCCRRHILCCSRCPLITILSMLTLLLVAAAQCAVLAGVGPAGATGPLPPWAALSAQHASTGAAAGASSRFRHALQGPQQRAADTKEACAPPGCARWSGMLGTKDGTDTPKQAPQNVCTSTAEGPERPGRSPTENALHKDAVP